MPLNGIPLHQRRVTRRRLIRNAQAQSTLSPLGVVRKFYFDTVLCQVPDPASTTASTGVTPYLNPDAAEPRHAINGIPASGTRRRRRLRCARTTDEQDASQRTDGLAKH